MLLAMGRRLLRYGLAVLLGLLLLGGAAFGVRYWAATSSLREHESRFTSRVELREHRARPAPFEPSHVGNAWERMRPAIEAFEAMLPDERKLLSSFC